MHRKRCTVLFLLLVNGRNPVVAPGLFTLMAAVRARRYKGPFTREAAFVLLPFYKDNNNRVETCNGEYADWQHHPYRVLLGVLRLP